LGTVKETYEHLLADQEVVKNNFETQLKVAIKECRMKDEKID